MFLFNGEQRVKPEELDSSGTISQYKASGKILSQERDTQKRWNNFTVVLAAFGLENQLNIHKFMPVRIMNYDSAEYRVQFSGGKAPERLYPVITLVLHFGEDRWIGHKALYDCVDIPDYLKPYVSNYKINVFDMHDLTDEIVEKFRSDFKHIAAYFKALYHSKDDYIPSNEKFDHPQEVVDFFTVFRKDKRFTAVMEDMNEKKGDVSNMCELLDRIENRGIRKGLEMSKNDGYDLGKNDGYDLGKNAIIAKMKKSGMSDEQINSILMIAE